MKNGNGPDINDEGPEGARLRHDAAWKEQFERAKKDLGSDDGEPAPKDEQPPPPPGPPPDAQEQWLAELNRDNCVVLDGGKTWVMRYEQVEHAAGGERYMTRVPTFLSFAAFREFYCNRIIHVGRGVYVPVGSWWLTHPDRRQYSGLIFHPGGASVIDGKFNLWSGWGVAPKQGDWKLMLQHIYEVLAAGNGVLGDYILNWSAWAVQHADLQAEAALIFLGDEGTGRGTFAKALCRIFGNHALHISSSDHLTGRFTGHLRQCCFLFADEAYAPEDRAAEGRLKRMITEDTLTIEAKRKDPREEPNRLKVVAASNHNWVIPAGAHARRFVVEKVAEIYRQKREWFGPLYQQMHDGGYAAMLFDLLHHDLGDFHPRNIVHTAALAEQQEESLSGFDAWWEDLLHHGHLPAGDSDGFVISGEYQVRRSEGYLTDNSKRTWFDRRKGFYEQARTSSPMLKRATDAAFGRYLVKRGCLSKRVLRQRGWWVPSLEQCRADWLERFPSTVWHDPDAKVLQGERDQDDNDGAD